MSRPAIYLATSFAACLLLVATPASWQSGAADGDAQQLRTHALIELMGGGASVEQLMNLVYQQTVSALLTANPNQGTAVQSFVDDFVLPEIRARVPPLLAAAAGNFAQAFTEDELNEIVAFYESPVGQKLRRARPALQRQLLQFGQLWAAQTFRETLQQLKPQLEAQGLAAPDI
jgi:hypothetical protein